MPKRLLALLCALGAFAIVVLPAASTTRSNPAKTFALTATQAEEVSAVVEFTRASNAQRLSESLAFFAPGASVSDCDYRRVRGVQFRGRRGIARWLRGRFADHDRLTIEEISDENRREPIGVALVEYSKRTNDTLSALGFPDGVIPTVAAKVVFGIGYKVGRPIRLKAFALGPGEGDSSICRAR